MNQYVKIGLINMFVLVMLIPTFGMTETQTGTIKCSSCHLKAAGKCQPLLSVTRDSKSYNLRLTGQLDGILKKVCKKEPVLADVTGHELSDEFEVIKTVEWPVTYSRKKTKSEYFSEHKYARRAKALMGR